MLPRAWPGGVDQSDWFALLSADELATVPQTADAFLSGDCDSCYTDRQRWEGGAD